MSNIATGGGASSTANTSSSSTNITASSSSGSNNSTTTTTAPIGFVPNPSVFQPYSFGQLNRLKYCCDLDKDVLSSNFEKRGWINVNNDEDWNFYWSDLIILNHKKCLENEFLFI